jgi:predicted nucleic acid-binding protein
LTAEGQILVDTSVWIDFFGRSPGRAGKTLRRLIEAREPLVLTAVVLTEILQGLTQEAELIERYLRSWDLLEARGRETYERAASLYRQARQRAISPSTIDVLIAVLAIENRAVLFTLGRDFVRLAELAPLRLFEIPA